MSGTTWINYIPIAAIDDTSGAWVNDTGDCFLSRAGRIRDTSVYPVARGVAVNLGTSKSEELGKRWLRILCVPPIRAPP